MNDRAELDEFAQRYAKAWCTICRVMESVGLGRPCSVNCYSSRATAPHFHLLALRQEQ